MTRPGGYVFREGGLPRKPRPHLLKCARTFFKSRDSGRDGDRWRKTALRLPYFRNPYSNNAQDMAKKDIYEPTISVGGWRALIVKALKKSNRYNAGLDFQIINLAAAMRTHDLAIRDIDELDTVTIVESNRNGEKTVPHPAFKVQRDASDSITRQLKILGLTMDDLVGKPDIPGPLDDLDAKMQKFD